MDVMTINFKNSLHFLSDSKSDDDRVNAWWILLIMLFIFLLGWLTIHLMKEYKKYRFCLLLLAFL